MNNFEQARNLLVSDLRKYLVGPAEGEDELIPERASDRYHLGCLAPSGTAIASEEDDTSDSSDAGGGDAKIGDGVLTLANAAQQSAVGFTIQAPVGCRLLIDAFWADYRPEVSNQSKDGTESRPDEGGPHSKAKVSYSWRRAAAQLRHVELPLVLDSESQTLAEQGGISLEVHERRIGSLRVLTVSLVNRRTRIDRTKKRDKNLPPEDLNVYQVRLAVRTLNGAESLTARVSSEYISDPEFLVHELLYRNVRQFSVGHGCATDWVSSDGKLASAVSSEWLPVSEVRKASSEVLCLDGEPAFDVQRLGTASREDVVAD